MAERATEGLRGERFVGRATELAALRAHLAEAKAGRARIVLVAGDAGIGKTRLLEELLAELPRERVLWGRCRDAVGAPAYWPWTQAIHGYADAVPAERLRDELGGLAGEVARVAPGVGALLGIAPSESEAQSSGEQARFQLFEAVTEFLLRASTDETLAIVLDDLHWADSESLLLLRHLGAGLGGSRLLLLGTYREVEMRQAAAIPRILGDLARVSQRITLRGLAEPEVESFAKSFVSTLPAATVAELYRTTDGNPFFVKQVMALLDRDGWDATGGRLPVPAEVREAVRRRLDPLTEPARRLLANAAVLGREFDLATISRLADLGEAETLALLAEPIVLGLVAETGFPAVRLRFAHAIVRETLYGDLAAAERADLHRAAGSLLESTARIRPDESLGEIAHHYLHAVGRDALEKAARHSLLAAEHAVQSLGYEEAAGHYERALATHQSLGSGPAERLPILLAFGKVQTLAGDVDGFRASFLEAAGIARQLGDAEALAHAAIGYGGTPSMQMVDRTRVGLLEDARRALPPEDSSLRANVLANLAMAVYYSAPAAERAAIAQEAVDVARRIGDSRTEAVALRSLYNNVVGSLDVHARLAILRDAIRAAEAAGDDALACETRANAMSDSLELGDVRAADRELALATATADRLRLPRWRWRTAVLHAVRALLAGDLAEAEALADRAFEMARSGVLARDALGVHVGILFNIRRAQGRLAELAPLIQPAVRNPGGAIWESLLALLHAETDDREAAAAGLAKLSAGGFETLRADWSRLPILAYSTDVCGAVGDAEAAARIEAVLAREAPPVVMCPTGCLGASRRLLGVLALVQGRADEAVRLLEEALALHARMDAPIDLARTRIDVARALAKRSADGDRERVLALLDEAEATARERGLARIAIESERLRASLAEAPVTARTAPTAPTAPIEGRRAFLRRDGEHWTIGCGDESVRLRHAKGVVYLRRLLGQPGRDFHATELAGLASSGDEAGSTPSPASAETVQRENARELLRELREELAEAEEFNDVGRAAAIREQIEDLAEAMTAGLREKAPATARGAASPAVERARLNVTRALQTAIRTIARNCPVLGRHLETSVRTGSLCSYVADPGFPVQWEF